MLNDAVAKGHDEIDTETEAMDEVTAKEEAEVKKGKKK
jgi:hypothetical protein